MTLTESSHPFCYVRIVCQDTEQLLHSILGIFIPRVNRHLLKQQWPSKIIKSAVDQTCRCEVVRPHHELQDAWEKIKWEVNKLRHKRVNRSLSDVI